MHERDFPERVQDQRSESLRLAAIARRFANVIVQAYQVWIVEAVFEQAFAFRRCGRRCPGGAFDFDERGAVAQPLFVEVG